MTTWTSPVMCIRPSTGGGLHLFRRSATEKRQGHSRFQSAAAELDPEPISPVANPCCNWSESCALFSLRQSSKTTEPSMILGMSVGAFTLMHVIITWSRSGVG
jgi:hypothetical protein